MFFGEQIEVIGESPVTDSRARHNNQTEDISDASHTNYLRE